MKRKLIATDVNIDAKEILANNLLKAINYCKQYDPVVQELEYHIVQDRAFNDENMNSEDIYFVLRKLSATSLYDNDVIPYTIFVYVNNNYADSARVILDTMCDLFSGNFQQSYTTYYDKNGDIVTVPDEEFNISNVLVGEESNIISSWANEIFEKAKIFNALIPSGAFYYATLYASSTFVINKNVSGLDISNVIFKDGEEECNIPIIQATMSFSIQHDTQPFFFDEKGKLNEFVKSEAKYATFTLTIVTPLKKNIFTEKVLNIVTQQRKKDPNAPSINSDFILNYTFLNGMVNQNNVFKLVDFGYSKTLAEADSISVSFTN